MTFNSWPWPRKDWIMTMAFEGTCTKEPVTIPSGNYDGSYCIKIYCFTMKMKVHSNQVASFSLKDPIVTKSSNRIVNIALHFEIIPILHLVIRLEILFFLVFFHFFFPLLSLFRSSFFPVFRSIFLLWLISFMFPFLFELGNKFFERWSNSWRERGREEGKIERKRRRAKMWKK